MISPRGISSTSTSQPVAVVTTTVDNRKKKSYFCSEIIRSHSALTIESRHYSESGSPLYRETLAIARHSFQRASSHPDFFANKETCLSSATPFHSWSIEDVRVATEKLKNLGLNVRKETLEKIYQLFQSRTSDLFQVNGSSPANFRCTVTTTDSKDTTRSSRQKFAIQIHSERRATLFSETDSSTIEKGASKTIKLAYALGNPQIFAYSLSNQSSSSLLDNYLNAKEQSMFQKFDGCPWIAQVHDLFYYHNYSGQTPYRQQCIQMYRYETDLFNYIADKNDEISTEEKWDLQLQLVRALSEMHSAGVVHRDIKPENFLVESGKLYLTDFGLAMEVEDPELKINWGGTPSSKPPEMLLKQEINHPLAIDSWGAGCIIWNLCFGRFAPWIGGEETCEPLVMVMSDFDHNPGHFIPVDQITNGFLIWSLLRYFPLERLTPREVLDIMENINSKPMRSTLENLEYFESLLPLQLHMYLKSFKKNLPSDLLAYLQSLEEGFIREEQRALKRKHDNITPATDPEFIDPEDYLETLMHAVEEDTRQHAGALPASEAEL